MVSKRGPPRRSTSVNDLRSASQSTRVPETLDDGTHTAGGTSSLSLRLATQYASQSPPMELMPQEEVLPSQTALPTQDETNLQQEEFGHLLRTRANEIIRCCTIEAGRLEPSRWVSHWITRIIQSNSYQSAFDWVHVPNSSRDMWYNTWKSHFWMLPADEIEIRQLWDQQASTRYNGILRTIRTSKRKPKWLHGAHYASYYDRWLTQAFQRRSEINQRDKLANPAVHTGGSISHAEHAKPLSKKLNRPISAQEFHKYIHTKKQDKQTFVNDRSREVSERVDQIFNERLSTPDAQPTPEDERAAYLETAGDVNPKERIYGLGLQATYVYPDEIRLPRVVLRGSNDVLRSEIFELRQEVTELRSEIADIRSQNAAFQRRMEAFISQLQQTPSFPSPSALDLSVLEENTFAPDEDTC